MLEPPQMSVSVRTLAEFRDKKDELVRKTLPRLMELGVDYTHLGDRAEEIMSAGFGFLTRMLETALEFSESAILAHQLAWSTERLPHDGVSVQMLVNNLYVYRQVVEENLSAQSGREIERILAWMIGQLEASDPNQ
ncbi:MAG: hypothetical protein JXJ17_15790 [Anaerolineae bacterium]|nr:hypothetical protein [Anaerolineae bacterium]